MSESDVSHIRDEELLRRMWQQSEDFSKKKEIRAHMYRLREERLRDLYSPEPAADKGSAFSSSRGHTRSFADQTFQSMKSKEVRDAGSPPKEFSYRGQDAAGWSTEEHRDARSSHRISSATSAERRYQKSSHATLQETTDEARSITADTRAVDREQTVERVNIGQGELISRKVERPSDNVKVVVEKRTLPDGTEITTTEREFRTPVLQRSDTEHRARQTTTESGAVTSSSTNVNESTIKTTQDFSNRHVYSGSEVTAPEVGSQVDTVNHKTVVISTDAHALASQETSKIRSQNKAYVASSQNKVKDTSIEKDSVVEKRRDTRSETALETDTKRETDHQDRYQTTYQSDYTDKKVSQDLSPTHQAWASTLRGDSPSKTSNSSNSTLRRSTSPEKPLNQSRSRTVSPSKYDYISLDRVSATSDIVNSNSALSHYQKSMSPSRSSKSPDRKITDRRQHSASPDKTTYSKIYSEHDSRDHEGMVDYQKSSTRHENIVNQSSRSSNSPEKQDPGYLKPTFSSTNHSQKKYDDVSESEHNTHIEYGSEKKVRSESPETYSTTTHNKTTNKTYRDESYDHVDNTTVIEHSTSEKASNKVFRKSSSPERTSPAKESSTGLVSSLRQSSPSRRSPSPPKGPVTFESDLGNVTNVHNITKTDSKQPLRDSSPLKYATCTKKSKLDKKSPRQSMSPVKISMRNSTHTDVNEFIRKEKSMEEHDRNIRVDSSRQLVTPSTSPTRKPKVEKDLSTGQSSPTTSVSEIIYFSSPRQSENRNIVTDLEETIYRTTERSPSPTKIPQPQHRVPSPEKHISTTKDNLPRKSSLKKTSFNYTTQQTSESSTAAEEVHDTTLTEHKVVKKDRPDKVNTTDEVPKRKEKPPLQRRETYEDRCRKILGMTESDTGEIITVNNDAQDNFTTSITSSLNGGSHSNSPRSSPTKEQAPRDMKTDKKYAQTNNDFITSEKESTGGVIINKTKSSSRNSSPTKLRDIISDESNDVTKSHKTKEINNVKNEQHTLQSFGSNIKTDSRRTPSPCKKGINVISDTKQFISKEKQREILSKVQNSLRKLSPTRDNKSKTLNKLEDLSTGNEDNSRIHNAIITSKETSAHDVISHSKTDVNSKAETIFSKPSSRNVSPDKKSTHVSTKKNVITSPKIQKTTKIPNVEIIVDSSQNSSDTKFFTNQSVSNSLKSDVKVDKNDLKKSTKILSKQNINTSYKNNKTTQVGNKPINKTNIITESIKKVSRTSSDNSIKYKKSTQRMSSRPEIHVNDISHNKCTSKLKVNEKISHRSSSKDTKKITNKPKSATALNTVTDTDDDIIIDIQQAKSSRENSPDRICPTPVFEDSGKPRLPDEVSEPEDDLIKRMHHIIHETESIVDDIVEISEDEELFVKKRDINKSLETDKVSKLSEYNKKFENTERQMHSDFIDENLKSDECMLTVSEKVSKFTNIKDDAKVSNRYPLENEYDSLSKYQDDYTKLSVNDKAHLFIESADNEHDIKVSKATQNSVELNVSDKVNKFITTAEKFLNEAHLQDSFGEDKVDEKSKQDSDSNNIKIEKCDDMLGTFAKETVSSHAKIKKYISPNLKTPERVPVQKITTLRSNEAIKKAKALFENMASLTTSEKKTSAKLADIGVNKFSTAETITDSDKDNNRENTQDNKKTELTTESLEKSNISKSRFSSTTSRQSPVEPTVTRMRSPRRHVDVQHEPNIHRHKNVEKQDTNNTDDTYEVSTRRGSGKFGVELKRTGQEKTSTERRRLSDDLRQPCIEDIYEVELLEQMLEKVVGYEQRRRIRAQIRVAKKKMDTTTNIHNVTSSRDINVTEHTTSNKRSYTDETAASKARSPTRRSSPEKKIRSVSPLKSQTSPNKNRFNEYASAYMNKVGLNTSKSKVDTKRTVTDQTATTTSVTIDNKLDKTEHKKPAEVARDSVARASSPRRSTKAGISPGHDPAATDKLYRRTPSPQFKRPLRDSPTRTLTDVIQTKSRQVQEDKPAWVTNKILKKTTSETRASSKKIETDKKYRAASPSKVVARPTDVITSGYGLGPLDADGRPLFGIKALRNSGGANYRVKGTVVQEEYHSHNGGEPEGTRSVTTYSNDPDYLDRVLREQDDRPSRIHGLAAITTTKKFGGDSGVTMKQVHNKEEHFHKKTKDSSNERKVCVDVEERKGKSEYRNENIVKEKSIKSVTNVNSVENNVDAGSSQHRKTVRQNSVKSLADKYTGSVSGSKERHPRGGQGGRGGLVLNTTTRSTQHTADGQLDRQEVMESGTSTEEIETRKVRREISSSSKRSFLDSGGVKVTGVQDILTRMKNADIVVEAGDSGEEAEARALLNKFLGATVLMAGMQAYVTEQPARGTKSHTAQTVTARSVREVDVENCWDEQLLRQLLEQSTDYEQRRRVRTRIRALMAEQQACADAVSDVLEGGGAAPGERAEGAGAENREEEVSIESSERRNSSETSVSRTSTTTKSSKVIESMTRPAPKPVSPFAKFRQLDKQNSTTNPSSPKTPQSPGSPSQPYFKFTEPALVCSAITIKERLLQWCRDKTREYENVKLENFSTSWSDGLAFCALIHHFLPDTFDYSKLTADKRRHNFTLAFKVADEKAGIYPLLDVDDMVAMRKPDWKCVFTYVQSIHRRFKDQS